MENQLVTREEKSKLEKDLKGMIDRRPVISKAIAEAREKGDLKENADYHAAREEYSLNESHIKHLEARLKALTVVDTSAIPEGMVFLGSTVKLRDMGSGDFETVRIVGEVGSVDGDSDIMEVSARSPLGEALVRARVGEKISVNVPRGTLRYEIVELTRDSESAPSEGKDVITPRHEHTRISERGDRAEAWTTDSMPIPFNEPTANQSNFKKEIQEKIEALDRSANRPNRRAVFAEALRYNSDLENLVLENIGRWKTVSAAEPIIQLHRRPQIICDCPITLSENPRFYYCFERSSDHLRFCPENFTEEAAKVRLQIPWDSSVLGTESPSKKIWLVVARVLETSPTFFRVCALAKSEYGVQLRLGIPPNAQVRSVQVKGVFDGVLTALHFYPAEISKHGEIPGILQLIQKIGQSSADEVRTLLLSKKNKILGGHKCLGSDGRLMPRDNDLMHAELELVVANDKDGWLEIQMWKPM